MTKRLTLTFDNGPDRTVTPQVLDELDRRGLSATFFVLGRRLDDDRLAIVRDAARRGHRIGNHTYSHPSPLGSLGPGAVDEITRTAARLGDLEAPDRLFRPSAGGGVLASGVLNADIVDHLTASGYTMVLWNAVVEDWVRGDGSWVDLALAALDENDWTLLVLHDLATGAMDALPRFLDEVAERGVEVVPEFPPDLTPIVAGEIIGRVDHLLDAGLN